MSRDWVKLHTCILDDPDINELPPELGWAWTRMVAMAGRTEDNGRIGDVRSVAYVLRVSPDLIAAVVTALGGSIIERDGELWFRDWSDWQVASARERGKVFRAEHANATNETERDRTPRTKPNAANETEPTRARPDQTRPEEKRPEENREQRGAADASPLAASGNGHKLSVDELRRHREDLFAAICDACGFDTQLLAANDRTNVGKLASTLVHEQPPWDPADVSRAGAEWATVRWRSKPKSEIRPPTVAQLRTWLGECVVRWDEESVFDVVVRS